MAGQAVAFSGSTSPHNSNRHPLKAAHHQLTLVATDAAGNRSGPRTAAFSIKS